MADGESFAYWLSHHNFVFSKIHESKSKKSLRETREYRCLLVSTDAEAARSGTDRQTDRQTHGTLLAHARRGLITVVAQKPCIQIKAPRLTVYPVTARELMYVPHLVGFLPLSILTPLPCEEGGLVWYNHVRIGTRRQEGSPS